MSFIYRAIKYIFSSIANCIKGFFGFSYWLLQLFHRGLYITPLKKTCSGTIAVMGNGPSLKEVLPFFTKNEEYKSIDFFVVNYFILEELFFVLKPKHYIFTDAGFLSSKNAENKNVSIDMMKKVFSSMQNDVDWELNLYVPHNRRKSFIEFSEISNKNINIIGVNTLPYKGFNFARNFMCKRGISIPVFDGVGSVILVAIYVSINNGYNNILLYGVDHDFFKSIAVDDNNCLCEEDKYFYSDKYKSTLSVNYNMHGNQVSVKEFFNKLAKLFGNHELMHNYAESSEANIINCTHHSFIDAYKRIPLDMPAHDFNAILNRFGKPHS